MKRYFLLAGLSLAASLAVRADEIRLKDGSKIVGEIVAFENDSFKVQTSYGFAVVRKDSIVQIVPAAAKTKQEAPAKEAQADAAQVQPTAAVEKKPVAQSAIAKPAKAPDAAPASMASASAPAASPARPASVAAAVSAAAETTAPPLAEASAPQPPTPPAATATPPPPPAPVVIRESLDGNLYRNDSFGFQLYRPPGWDLLPQARNSVPNAITAMGTADETALFIIGREPVREVLEAQAADAERAVRKIYENYRHVSTTKRTVSGLPAVQWQFRGMADGHDWSVTALTIAHGPDVFTLLGMTYADSDLIQIRENVIAKMLASVQFTAGQ